MSKDEVKNVDPIKSYSFMVEVIEKPKCPTQFIVRFPDPRGTTVLCMGTIKEFYQFIESL